MNKIADNKCLIVCRRKFANVDHHHFLNHMFDNGNMQMSLKINSSRISGNERCVSFFSRFFADSCIQRFWMRPRIPIRGCVRPSVRPSVRRSVRHAFVKSQLAHPELAHPPLVTLNDGPKQPGAVLKHIIRKGKTLVLQVEEKG